VAGRVVGVLIENKTNSAQLELELGLSLAIQAPGNSPAVWVGSREFKALAISGNFEIDFC
jgi:hypothetical protein